jgi:hypothetical protein
MMGGLNVVFADAEVLATSDVMWMCRVGRKTFAIAPCRMLAGTTLLSHPGARGQLVMTREMAAVNGLADLDHR